MNGLLKTQARPYTKAAYEVASRTRHLKGWQRFLQNAVSIARHEEISRLLKNKHVAAEQLQNLFCDILKKDFLDDYCRNFLTILIEARKLVLLPEILSLFSVFEQESRNILAVKIVSAFKLTSAEQSKLEKLLGKKFQKKIYLDCEIDSGVIAGLIVKVNNFVIDSSAKTLLNQLHEYLNT